jgi:agmatine/peptidylarginine deiminase
MNITRRLAVFGIVLSLLGSRAARAEWDVDGLEELLPHAPSALDTLRFLAREGPPVPRELLADPPPAAPIRNCAEWEPMTGALIRYPLGLPYALLRDLDDVVILHVVVASNQLATAKSSFVANGVDTTKVQWLVEPNNSIWTRDYGPWFVFDGNGDEVIVDHVYNRPQRPDDDLIPVYFGAQQGIPVVRHDMWHTGGNYMTDGAHWSMSTDLVYDEAHSANGMTPEEVDQLMEDYYGVTTYDVVDDISASGIHHIDTWGKFLDEETIVIKQVWPAQPTYAALEQRATLIASLPASTGRSYRVFRVYCHDIGGGNPASYTNSLILNDRVCVPMFSSASNDTAALAVYRTAMPGYDVKGYAYGGWLTDDALHCRVMGVADRSMLRVAHVPVRETQTAPVPITAFVDDRSEAGVASVELHYRFAGESWQTVAMAPAGGDDYAAAIPSPLAATTVDYYVIASDLSGRQEGMPRSAPAGFYTFPIEASPTSVAVRPGEAPDGLAALVGPNPFRSETRFSFELRYPERVILSVHDVTGRLVRRLADGEQGAGRSEFVWDGRDDGGRRVADGVYFFRLRAAGIAYSRPVVLRR